MKDRKENRRTPQVFQTTWSNIPITITFKENYWSSVNVSHLEVKADEPLPITETGYRSIWIMPGELEGTNPVDFVLSGLDEMSLSKKWKSYLEDKKQEELAKTQLSLF
jgi:hypothetical protein